MCKGKKLEKRIAVRPHNRGGEKRKQTGEEEMRRGGVRQVVGQLDCHKSVGVEGVCAGEPEFGLESSRGEEPQGNQHARLECEKGMEGFFKQYQNC